MDARSRGSGCRSSSAPTSPPASTGSRSRSSTQRGPASPSCGRAGRSLCVRPRRADPRRLRRRRRGGCANHGEDDDRDDRDHDERGRAGTDAAAGRVPRGRARRRRPGAGPHARPAPRAGFGAVGITSFWQPGLTAPPAGELAVLKGVARRAKGLRVFVAVYQPGSSTTPLTGAARRQFASYAAAIVEAVPEVRDLIVGNEPNLNRFWMPQFDESGGNAAAPAYFALLVATYDAVKQANPDVTVWGGALAPRGIDRPGTGRDTHSPRTFIRDLGAAYRASGRE